MAEPKIDTPLNAFGGFDIFNSSKQSKEFGFHRFQQAMPELVNSDKPTKEILLQVHSLITPDITTDNLHPAIRKDMELGLMILDRPDKDRVFDLAMDVFHRVGKSGHHKQLRPLFNDVREELKSELSRFTHITFQPGLKGTLRSYGKREIEGQTPEPIVYASHTLVMAGAGQLLAMQWGQPDIIFPDSYYGLSTGLADVYALLCDRYDSISPQTTRLPDILLREAYFQVLGTRLLHPFWDGNGRAFTGQLAVSLEKQGVKGVDLQQLQKASVVLGDTGDAMVERVLKNAKLSLVTDRPGNSLTLSMWLNPHMRQDYMTKLQTEIKRAIESADNPNSDYYELIHQARRDLETAVTKS